jgi:hypothetical protein
MSALTDSQEVFTDIPEGVLEKSMIEKEKELLEQWQKFQASKQVQTVGKLEEIYADNHLGDGLD